MFGNFHVLICCIAFLGLGIVQVIGGNLTDAERGRLAELRRKQPPENCAAAFGKLKRENEELYSKKVKAEKNLDELRNTVYANLKNDVDFLNIRNQHLANDKENLLKGFDSSQSKARQFNQNLSNFLSERVARSSFTLFRPPVFRGKEILLANTKKSLVIDLQYRARHDIGIVGGEILTAHKGKVQFVFLHKEGGEYKIQTAGEEFEITDEDFDKKLDAYRKSLIFTENFQELSKGDCFGVFIDGNIGLTYNNVGLSSAAVINLDDGILPKSIPELPPVEDKLAPRPTGESDAWKRFSVEQNVGRSYSFNMFGEIVLGE